MLVTTYHPQLPPVSKIVKKHWKVMVDESPRLKRCFKKPSVVAYKRSKNLRDILIRAKIPPKTPKRIMSGFKNCGELCLMCPYTPSGTTKIHSCNLTGEKYPIVLPINCKTSGVVYKIMCKKCPGFIYIGETGRTIKERFSEHRRDARNRKKNKPCGEHFSRPGHSKKDPAVDMIVLAIEKVVPSNDTMLRQCRETLWINQYQSVDYGANLRS